MDAFDGSVTKTTFFCLCFGVQVSLWEFFFIDFELSSELGFEFKYLCQFRTFQSFLSFSL